MRNKDRIAVFQFEFREDLRHWVETDRRVARRLTQEHRLVYLVRDERVDFLQARFHY